MKVRKGRIQIEETKFFIDMDGVLAVWGAETDEKTLLTKGYFRNRPPYPNMIKAVKSLCRISEKVYILSHYIESSKYALSEKSAWIDEHLPEISKEHRIFCPQIMTKSDAASLFLHTNIKNTYVLIDDYSKNLFDWVKHGGVGIKCLNGVNNTNGTWAEQKLKLIDVSWTPIQIARGIVMY